MRQIGFIDDERDAERFGDYLLSQGIVSSIEEMNGGAWAVWIEDDDHLERGRQELDRFRANPADPRYDAAGDAKVIRKHAEKAEHRRRQNFIDVRTRWSHPAKLARPVTIILAAVSILVAVATRLGSTKDASPVMNALLIAPIERTDDGFIQWEGLDAIRHGQVWRLVTPIFLHFGIAHILFNMFGLLDFGSLVEMRRGSIFMVIFVLVTAVTSNVAQYYLPDPSHPNPTFGGMSGVLYALFGYAWIKGKFQPHLGIGVAPQTVTVMLFWLVLCMTGLVGDIANVAHVVGLLGGAAFAYVPYAFKRVLRR
jgi:GlpG protein